MRCIAMAQACRAAGGRVAFVTQPETSHIAQRCGILGSLLGYKRDAVMASITEIAERLRMLGMNTNDTWILVDGYRYTNSDIVALQSTGYKVARIVDSSAGTADLIINPHLYARKNDYACASLCGLAYAPIRSDFRKCGRPKRDYFAHPKRILVSLGGYANMALAHEVVEYLASANGYEIVVTGVQRQDAALQRDRVRVINYLHDVPQIMAWADVGILTASVACYEALYMGLPVLVASVASNQEQLLGTVLHAGACVEYTGSEAIAGLAADGTLRKVLGDTGARLIDGNGSSRILKYLEGHL